MDISKYEFIHNAVKTPTAIGDKQIEGIKAELVKIFRSAYLDAYELSEKTRANHGHRIFFSVTFGEIKNINCHVFFGSDRADVSLSVRINNVPCSVSCTLLVDRSEDLLRKFFVEVDMAVQKVKKEYYSKLSDDNIKEIQNTANKLRQKLDEVGARLVYNYESRTILVVPNTVDSVAERTGPGEEPPSGVISLDESTFKELELPMLEIDTGNSEEYLVAPITVESV